MAVFPDIEGLRRAPRWQWLCARLFGRRITLRDGTVARCWRGRWYLSAA